MRYMLKNKKGSVLAVTVVVTLISMLIGGAFALSLAAQSGQIRRYIHQTKSFQLAEAGVESAIWEIRYGAGDFQTSDGWAGAPHEKIQTMQSASGATIGDYKVAVTDLGSDNYLIQSTGYYPDRVAPLGQRTVQVETEYLEFPPGLFAEDGINIYSNVRVDSYDSALGSYGGNNGDIGTNSIATSPPAISLSGNAILNGDISIGPDGDVYQAISLADERNLNGDMEVLAEPVDLPAINAPSGLPNKGSISLTGFDNNTIDSDGKYENFQLDNHSTVTFTNDAIIHITGEFNILSNSKFIIENNATVVIYVDGKIQFDSNVEINNVGKIPREFFIVGTDQLTDGVNGEPGIDLNSNETFYGVIYSPYATVNIDSNADIFGAIVGKHITLDSNVKFHFDEDLLNSPPDPFGHGVKPGSWVEK